MCLAFLLFLNSALGLPDTCVSTSVCMLSYATLFHCHNYACGNRVQLHVYTNQRVKVLVRGTIF